MRRHRCSAAEEKDIKRQTAVHQVSRRTIQPPVKQIRTGAAKEVQAPRRGSEAGLAAYGRVRLPVQTVNRVPGRDLGGGDARAALATLRCKRTAHRLQEATVGSLRALAAGDIQR